jgi:hypothetical protein
MEATTRIKGWFWRGEEPEWLVVVMVLTALLAGAVLMAVVTSQTQSLSADDLSLRYPAGWSWGAGEGNVLAARELASQTALTVRVLRKLDPAAPVTMDDLVTQLSFERGKNLPLYRVLVTRNTRVDGKSGVAVSYTYVYDPAPSVYQSALPIVMRGTDYIVPYKGKAYVISMEASAQDYDSTAGAFAEVLRSIRWR